MKKFILAVWVMLCTMPSTFAYAADLPSEKGIERIKMGNNELRSYA